MINNRSILYIHVDVEGEHSNIHCKETIREKDPTMQGNAKG